MKPSAQIIITCVLFGAGCAAAPPASTLPQGTRSCADVAQEERGWMALRDDVDAVEPLTETGLMSKLTVARTAGVTVHVRATPGLTEQWLTRVARCHLARIAARAACTDDECLFARAGVAARVAPEASGFALALRSDDPAVAAEICRVAPRYFRR